MLTADLLTEARYVCDDLAGPPYAWSDTRLQNWMADGEDRFCELTGFFTDASSYTLTTVAGTTDYPLPSNRIIEVKSIWDGAHQLTQFTEADRARIPYYDITVIPNQRPQRWQMDKETGMISFLESPLDGIALKLRVHRRSAKRLTDPSVTAPSIPEQCHLALVEYAAAMAFSDHDRERQDPVKARDHMANFERYVRIGQDLFDRLNNASMHIAPSRQYVV